MRRAAGGRGPPPLVLMIEPQPMTAGVSRGLERHEQRFSSPVRTCSAMDARPGAALPRVEPARRVRKPDSHAAASSYSWMSPPIMSRRSTAVVGWCATESFRDARSGGLRPSEQCALCAWVGGAAGDVDAAATDLDE